MYNFLFLVVLNLTFTNSTTASVQVKEEMNTSLLMSLHHPGKTAKTVNGLSYS